MLNYITKKLIYNSYKPGYYNNYCALYICPMLYIYYYTLYIIFLLI